ncbi:MAG: nitronate monooxygenase [Lachnospiraceae bacterium]|nr:nitronate monooxygenase [Lachnospiraceae bacterium]
MKTRLTELFGIQYPIIQSGMLWVTDPAIVIAVSEAGGLGVLTAHSHPTAEALAESIRRIKAATDKPFGINISMLPAGANPEKEALIRQFFRTVIEEGVPIVETAGRNPEEFIPMLKEAGVKVIHKCTAARFARKAESVGVDAVEIIGYEAGGHPGMDDIGTMVLVQQTMDTVKIPVAAGGGVVDGRGLAAMLALGADGAVVGTRFALSEEATTHPAYRSYMLERTERDTVLIQRSIKNAARVVKNDAAAKVLAMEAEGKGLADLLTITAGTNVKKNVSEGLTDGMLYIGQGVGLIHEIKPVAQIIEEMVAGAREIAEKTRAALAD